MTHFNTLELVESKTMPEAPTAPNLDLKSYYDGFSGLRGDASKTNPVSDGQMHFSNIFDGHNIKGASGDKTTDKDSVQMLGDGKGHTANATDHKPEHTAGHTGHNSHVVSADKLAKEAEKVAHDMQHHSSQLNSSERKFEHDMNATMKHAMSHGGLKSVWEMQQKTNDILKERNGEGGPQVWSELKNNGHVQNSLTFGKGAQTELSFKHQV